ncbi:glutaredoxin domain-containing protein [Prescottella agglutinans]|uniref:Glutaredoxin-like protein NrdH n=1 Tax=Prescottella agglutinans TaxID=1644129 RepID=A0ABT6MES6_9NOCA|nr:glutaredoxin domain-containing protein [Prescottella agglutinans]MDH6282826.1 glutaredoxin-like protein NrdH [Prescottella agglutinans]
MQVTVYSQPSCMPCHATKKRLTLKGIPHTVVDVSDNPDALNRVKALGYQSTPVVEAGDTHWGGYSPDKIDHLARELAAIAYLDNDI